MTWMDGWHSTYVDGDIQRYGELEIWSTPGRAVASWLALAAGAKGMATRIGMASRDVPTAKRETRPQAQAGPNQSTDRELSEAARAASSARVQLCAARPAQPLAALGGRWRWLALGQSVRCCARPTPRHRMAGDEPSTFLAEAHSTLFHTTQAGGQAQARTTLGQAPGQASLN